MSRQSKTRNKRMVRNSVVYENDAKGQRIAGSKRKGPARTTPKHGKSRREPYDANAAQRRRAAS